MEHELLAVTAALDTRDLAFREQVERMRAFRDRMKEAGVDVRANKFQISLTEGMSPPPRRVLTHS